MYDSRRKNWKEPTAGDVLGGALISPSLFKISHSAESAPAACLSSPWAKRLTLSSMSAPIVSVVESSIVQACASWLT